MAIAIEPKSENYVDLPLTNFPIKEDTMKRMTDVNAVLMPVVRQYNTYFADGNLAACNDLLKNNPDVLDCFFNADKWNWTRDAIIAIQRFFSEEVVTFINNVAQNTVGINDSPTSEQASLVLYSAEKVDSLITLLTQKVDDNHNEVNDKINKIEAVKTATLSASGWSNTVPYTQSISVAGTSANDRPIISIYLGISPTAVNVKAQNKAWGMVDRAVSSTNTITFYCYNKKPTVDFSVQIKGV